VVTVNSHWDNKVAVLLGDFFYGKALQQAVQCGISVVELMAEIIDCLVTGEWMQLEEAHNLLLSEERYFKRIEMKTARFISASCRLGALAAGATDEMREALAGYGRNLGMAYQIQDDILDIIGDGQKTGKPTCVDLDDGHITLPIIHALREGSYRQEFLTLLERKVYDQPARQRISFWLQDGGSIEYASLTAHKFVVNAKACLCALPGGIVNQALHNIADFACQRAY
jgi:heptaprenyl diphosphate synthase